MYKIVFGLGVVCCLCTSGLRAQSNEVGLFAPNLFTEDLSEICVPISIRNFVEVGAFQMGVRFDPEILFYDFGFIPREIVGINVGDSDSNQGNLKLVWLADFSIPSMSLPDDAVLSEICFDIIGPVGSKSPISFVDLEYFPIEITGELGTTIPHFVQNGSVTIGFEPPTVPTLNQWGIILLGLVLMILSVVSLKTVWVSEPV